MSTISLRVECTRTVNASQRRLLASRASFADVDQYKLSSDVLRRGESRSYAFTRLFFCSVNQPTLIRLTVDGNTVELTITSTILIPARGQVEIVNPESNPITLSVNVDYVVV